MEIRSTSENDWYKWHYLKPNPYGFVHILEDKRKGKRYLVHATMCRFPFDGDVCTFTLGY